MKSLKVLALLPVLLLGACATTPYGQQESAVGAGAGALFGAVIDHRNPIAGALVGGTLGAVVGGAHGDAQQYGAYPPPPPPVQYQYAPPPPPVVYESYEQRQWRLRREEEARRRWEWEQRQRNPYWRPGCGC